MKNTELGNTITFNVSKKEVLNLEDVKVCCRKLISMGFLVAVNNGEISKEVLRKSKIIVFLCPRENFTSVEINCLRKYIMKGGKVLVTGHVGKKTSNLFIYLKMYGIDFFSDCVIRVQRHPKYHDPKECQISDGIANKTLYSLVYCDGGDALLPKQFPILYSHGCTIDINQTNIVLLSTGSVCYPFHRPICVICRNISNGGRVTAFGSTLAFSDSYILKEKNLEIFHLLITIMIDDTIVLNIADIQSPDVLEYAVIPNICCLSALPYTCLQEVDHISRNLLQVAKPPLYQFDNKFFPKILSAYKEMNMIRKELTIIKPKFEVPFPEIQPAFIPPRFRSLSIPPLELMDLDDFFVSPLTKLEQLTNKYCDKELEYYIKACVENILLFPSCTGRSAKDILSQFLQELVLFKSNCF
ncbi:intraflagellar transport protein 52 homolog [Parasteatoda tepidariorum]|uniref:intraflagellar transport protein 52 homolog n=1 Tax=Parasteatoda tepidariorum TaxID=114398 RepID=UPI001C7259D6|nr:intraflagellar transport protein 52 homolog [Parasteatoda tepidariorum]